MHLAIIGAGRMGTEIAHAAALGGGAITLHDTDERALRIALGKISRGIDRGVRLKKTEATVARRAKRAFTLTTDLARCAAADVVIEAITERMEIKQALFQALDELVRPATILATTTNTLPVTALAAATRLPSRVIGLHFFNPVYAMRLVEVIRTPHTAQPVTDRAVALVRALRKTPVVVADAPGQLVSRVAQAYYGEAMHLLDETALDIQTIDRLMEAAGFPMGPFRLMDFIGVDTAFAVTRTIYEGTFHAAPYRPHPRQQRLIQAGRLGRASKRGGFYANEKAP